MSVIESLLVKVENQQKAKSLRQKFESANKDYESLLQVLCEVFRAQEAQEAKEAKETKPDGLGEEASGDSETDEVLDAILSKELDEEDEDEAGGLSELGVPEMGESEEESDD